jgi:glycosyltransferase involved in cell wall biosynthesis
VRILHVTPYYERAWAYGGIPRIATALATGLAARHDVTVCTTDACDARDRLTRPAGAPRAGPWREASPSGAAIRVFPNLSNSLAYHLQVFVPRGLSAWLRTHARDFDVAHLHACRNLPGAIAARALTRAGVPYVLAPNGTAPRIERRHLAKRVFDATVGRHVMRDAARVLAVTDAERRQLEDLGVPPDRIRVIPNPVDLAEFDAPRRPGAFRERLRLGAEPIVMYLGKITPRKRLDTLARAFARLQLPTARLVIAGNDMGYARELQRLIDDLRIRDRTTLTGLVAGHARLEALADADVVVYAGQHEIFGLVPLEAILCGTPVIVADDSGCGEVIRHVGGGLIVPEGEDTALRDAIVTILTSTAHWKQTAGNARTAVREFCGSDAVCRRLEALYGEVEQRGEISGPARNRSLPHA